MNDEIGSPDDRIDWSGYDKHESGSMGCVLAFVWALAALLMFFGLCAKERHELDDLARRVEALEKK